MSKCHLSLQLNEEKEQDLEKRVPGRGTSKHRVPEVGTTWTGTEKRPWGCSVVSKEKVSLER